MKWILKLLLTALAVLLVANILPGVAVISYTYAIWVALVIGLLNSIVRPLLIFLTLPATLITLGLFFICNKCLYHFNSCKILRWFYGRILLVGAVI